MDLDQHGSSAYPEYVIPALTAPAGMAPTIGSGKLPSAPHHAALVGSE